APPPPEAPPLPPVPLPSPPPAVAPPPVAPPPVAPPPRRQRRPRLWDPQTQIPAEDMRRNLSDQWGGCRVREPLELPQRRPPKELLSTPSLGPLPPPLQRLWALCAKPRPPARPRPPEEEPTPELPSEVEVPREALEPSLAPPSSEISVEPMEEEPSIPFLPAPPPEVVPELPEAPAIELRRLILDHAQAPEGAEFGDIMAPDWPRPRVAQAFVLCLDLCASHWLKLEQPRPYGPIRIRLRPRRQ
ncbi:meiotic recombination protein REC8 homolog, partial [Haemorhous mexicanus]|uniref:meiotic recombination protein REC8 homolog n=1 Tax=Haemorhous mexicanus TaxID=30427 RepID=UPI0028BF31EA